MPRRKELKGIAYATADHFISRYNSFNGYWALGILYKQANLLNINKVCFDILNQTVLPKEINPHNILSYFNEFISKQLDGKKFKNNVVKKIIIEVEFNLKANELEILYKNIYGNPFECRVFITDDFEKTYSYTRRSCCRGHNSSREMRSCR